MTTRSPRRFWRHWSWLIRFVALVLLAGFVGLAVWKALTIPNEASRRAEQRLREDNVQLCAFFRRADVALGKVFVATPKTSTGSVYQQVFIDLQDAARGVTVSPLCPLPKLGTAK